VEIRWPGRHEEKYENLVVNREYSFRQGDGSSKA